MKAIVTSRFIDKDNYHVTHDVGTVVDFDKDRIADLVKRGFVKVEKPEKTDENKPDGVA
jgi:hypothetical protein